MKGFPLLRALLALIVIGTVAIPLGKVTRSVAVAEAPKSEAVAIHKIQLQLTFSAPPKSVTVLHLGKTVWTQDAPGTEAKNLVDIPYPPEGVDLQFRVNWPPDTAESALRVRLTDPQGDEHEKTFWGRGEVEETLTFP